MTEEIIKTKLGFLISDYGFEFSSNSDGMRYWCKFTNNYGSLNWYTFEQFEEYKLYIEINGKGEQIKFLFHLFLFLINLLFDSNK